jgi:penicillin-binding protein 1C
MTKGWLTNVGRLASRPYIVVTAIGVVVAALWIRFGAIDPALLQGIDTPSTVVVDRNGEILYEPLSVGGGRTQPIEAARIPPVLEAATLAAEDRRFYSHVGVDPIALLRAARHDLLEGAIVEGGSTITQQTAKQLLQRRDGVNRRGLRAKLREMVLAVRLEHRFTKRQILALYLNVAPYGNQATGAARASRIYFGVDPSMLTPAQAAFLAALPQRPTAFNPWKNVGSARARQLTVLQKMAGAGMLTAAQLQDARGERLALAPRQARFAAPHFVEMVLNQYGDGGRPPARVVTTIDLALQRDVEGIVERQRETLRAHGAANVAVVVLDNATAEWLAWEGSGDYGDVEHGGAINGPVVARQPGSALKPFTYALAFEMGRTPATVLPDIPSHFPTAEPGVLYTPRNYDGRYRGPLLARRALAGSENVPAVALASDLGVSTLMRFLGQAGLTTFDRTPSYYGLGLTLGNAEVRLDELVAAYSSFARGGVWKKPTGLLPPEPDLPPEGGIHKNQVVASRSRRKLVTPRTAFWITDILSDDDARAFIFGRGGNLEFPFPVAVKTGTSQAYHDNWTIGYTRDVTVGVWVGNFDRTPLRDSSGVTGAGPIFHAVMLAAEHRASSAADTILPPTADVEPATICALSGMRANPSCPLRVQEWLPAGETALPCSWHHQAPEGVVTIYPAAYRAWAAEATKSLHSEATKVTENAKQRAPWSPSPLSRKISPPSALQISNPPSGALYSLDPTLRREFQALPLRAVSDRPTTITWSVDGRPIGSVSSESSMPWPLSVGEHEIEARDAEGHRTRTKVLIK